MCPPADVRGSNIPACSKAFQYLKMDEDAELSKC